MSGREERVCENLRRRVKAADLEEQVQRVLVPTETVSEIKGGKKRNYKRKIYPGYVIVEGDTIRAVGEAATAPGSGCERIDASDMLVIPGYINAQTHLCMTLGRSLGPDRSALMSSTRSARTVPDRLAVADRRVQSDRTAAAVAHEAPTYATVRSWHGGGLSTGESA